MKLVFFRGEQGTRLGVSTSGGIADLGTVSEVLSDSNEWSRMSERLSPLVSRAPTKHSEADLRLAPSLPFVGKIVCVGLNYRRHAQETGAQIPSVPILFSKYANALAAHGDSIAIPAETTQPDYEVELAVVMGRNARHVSVEH